MLQDILSSGRVEYLETNLNLETNGNIQAQWKHFNSIQQSADVRISKKLKNKAYKTRKTAEFFGGFVFISSRTWYARFIFNAYLPLVFNEAQILPRGRSG